MQEFVAFAQAHPLLIGGLAVTLLALIINEMVGAATSGPLLSPSDAVRLMNDSDAFILDVRPAPDFKKSHLLHAVNVPRDKLKDRMGELPKDKSRPLVVVCALGGAATEVAKDLRKQGYTSARALRGGVNAWATANLPLTAK